MKSTTDDGVEKVEAGLEDDAEEEEEEEEDDDNEDVQSFVTANENDQDHITASVNDLHLGHDDDGKQGNCLILTGIICSILA